MPIAGAIAAILLAATVPAVTAAEAHSPPAAETCETGSVKLDKDFVAGAFASCETVDANTFRIAIAPEDEGEINCSPWYAFRLTPARRATVTVEIDYARCGHRYWPKTSIDGRKWTRLPEGSVEITGEDDMRRARLTLELGSEPVFVSAQEIIGPEDFTNWLDRIERPGFATRDLLGQSAQGRDIERLTIADPETRQRETVVLVGRQHPPEVTGTLALAPFVETLMEDSALARAFRTRFETIVVPLLNPDGVVLGHWRHNTGGVDLNRDWGPFTQPETQLMDGLLRGIESDPERRLRVLLDFHSTRRDVFYTIPDELPTDPELFTRKWLALYQERMPDYTVERDARHTVGRPISKAHTFDTYGAPGITFEIGDETDRRLIWRIGRESAIAMMTTLLQTPRK
ncbi:MAG: M14-type cytosolic carboxypeptidase [Erythrobacter sp.]|nr:M14-type cytosolic carboxypeptidase [Erythrobacter sp.]